MAPSIGPKLASLPAAWLGVGCLLIRAFILAPTFSAEVVSKSGAYNGSSLISHLFFQAWGIFAAGVNHPVGFIVIGELSFLVSIYVLLGMMECAKVRARWGPLVAVPLLQLLPACLGASTSFALVWLPSYLRARAPTRSFTEPARAPNLYLWGLSTAFPYFVLTSSLLAMSLAHRAAWVKQAFDWFYGSTRIFHGLWVALHLVHPLRDSEPNVVRHLLESARRVNYLAAAALGALWRAYTLALLFNDPTLPSQAWSLLTSHGSADASEAAVRSFMLDLIGFTLLFVYFALLEDGPRVALRTLAGAFFLGPAPAFALYCAYREKEIARAAASERKDE